VDEPEDGQDQHQAARHESDDRGDQQDLPDLQPVATRPRCTGFSMWT
jgi:hypothetical protein